MQKQSIRPATPSARSSGDNTEIFVDDTEVFGDDTEVFGGHAPLPREQSPVAQLTSKLNARSAIATGATGATGDRPHMGPPAQQGERTMVHPDRAIPWIAPPASEHTAAMTGAPAWVPEPVTVTGTGTGADSGPAAHPEREKREHIAEPNVPLTLGAVLNGRFRLVDELGRGGMGVVYRAIDQRKVDFGDSDHFVAIKVLSESFKRHPEAIRTLQLEAKKSMKLAHPNIVQVRDFDRADGNVFMVMELLEGRCLQQLLREQYPLGMPLRMAMEIVRGLGDAIAHAHEQGIVHSDLKPRNVFITRAGQVKVLDFGVARVHQALDLEQTVFDVGALKAMSPPYASIEMLNGAAPDPRDDVYALACVTYLMLTGRHPFGEMTAVRARAADLAPARIRMLPAEAWQALASALAFERSARTPSVRQFVAGFCSAGGQRRAGTAIAALLLVVATGAVVTASLRHRSSPVGPVLTQRVDGAIAGPLPAPAKPDVAVHTGGPVAPEARAEQAATVQVPLASEAGLPASVATDAATVASVPLSAEMKLRLVESFRDRAVQQLADGDPDAAMATMASARRRMGYSNADLKSMELAFARVGEEFDRLRTAASLVATAHRQYLSDIRLAAGEELYPQLELVLARTLANRIADLRARSDRDIVAGALLASGRDLFPGRAELLEQGAPDSLGSAPLAVGEVLDGL